MDRRPRDSPTTIDCAAASAVRVPDLDDCATSAAALRRPGLTRHVVRELADGKSETILLIDGVRCAACCWLIERTLGLVTGVSEVGVNAGAQRARIVYDDKVVSLTRIVDALARVGYRALPLDRAAIDDTRRREMRDAQKRLAVAGFGAMQAMMYASALWFGAFDGRRCRDARPLPVADAARGDARRVLCGGAVFRRREAAPRGATPRHGRAGGAGRRADLRRQLRRGRHRRPRCLVRVGQHVRVLPERRPLPRNARPPSRRRPVRRAGAIVPGVRRPASSPTDRWLRVGAIELVPGDRVVVADGAGVPADGVLESAQCRVDEALLSGESAAGHQASRRCDVRRKRRRRQSGDHVRVSASAPTRSVAGIVALTARAATTKPRLARAGEQAAAGFVAWVLLLGACTAHRLGDRRSANARSRRRSRSWSWRVLARSRWPRRPP